MVSDADYQRIVNLAQELSKRVQAVLDIDPAEHATASRDFGRGFAACHKLVIDTLNNLNRGEDA